METISEDLRLKETTLARLRSNADQKVKESSARVRLLESGNEEGEKRRKGLEQNLLTEKAKSQDLANKVDELEISLAKVQDKIMEADVMHENFISKLKIGHLSEKTQLQCDVDRFSKEAKGKLHESSH